MIERTFDRIESFDPRSRQFPVVEQFEERELISRVWNVGSWLDQGREGACVAFGITHALLAEPKQGDKEILTEEFAHDVYQNATENDEFPGKAPEQSGTSVKAGLVEVKKRGLIKSFHWSFRLHEALLGLAWYGPAVIGVKWTRDMTEPDEWGFIHPTGRVVGGHCCLVSSINIHRETVCIHNSWGADWGTDGRAWLTWEDFESLLEDGGECAFLDKP